MKYGLQIILILLFKNFYSQSGTWTWMKGDNIPNQSAVYGTQGISSPTNKPAGTYEGTQWTDLAGNFWLYDNKDLWKFNPTSLNWTWMNGPQGVYSYGVYGNKGIASPLNQPGYRGLCAASWVDNTGDLWLFGGQGYNGYKNDLWKYNISSNQWTWIAGDSAGNKSHVFGTKGISNPSVTPGGLAETCATWTDSNNNLWLFGGMNGVPWNTLWKFNISSGQWTWMSGDNFASSNGSYGTKNVASPTNVPSARYAYTRWIKNDTLWLFGGLSIGPLNDLWIYSISTNMWTWVGGPNNYYNKGIYNQKCLFASSHLPYSRFETRSCWTDINGNFWFHSGNSAQVNGAINDLWVYNSNLKKWSWVDGDSIPSVTSPNYGTILISNPSNTPGSRHGSVSWVDGFNNLWLFGGTDDSSNDLMNDMWKYQIPPLCLGNVQGIKEFNYSSDISITPNPFIEKIEIKILIKHTPEIEIVLRNLQGRIVYSEKHESVSKFLSTTIDVSKLELLDGIYILDILIDNNPTSRKVIKLDK